jgi:hypothetical protein
LSKCVLRVKDGKLSEVRGLPKGTMILQAMGSKPVVGAVIPAKKPAATVPVETEIDQDAAMVERMLSLAGGKKIALPEMPKAQEEVQGNGDDDAIVNRLYCSLSKGVQAATSMPKMEPQGPAHSSVSDESMVNALFGMAGGDDESEAEGKREAAKAEEPLTDEDSATVDKLFSMSGGVKDENENRD